MSEMSGRRELPAPQTTPETEAFWAAAGEGRLCVGRCAACGRAHYYPRRVCPFCLGEAALETARGTGEIYTLSITYRGAPAPYAIGYVTLDEGPRILTNFLAPRLEDLRIGQRVRVQFAPSEGGPPVPVFAPA